MKKIATIFLAACLTWPLLAATASACPLCREAIDADGDSGGDHDPNRLARAYNYTIYLFLAMPPVLMGGLGLIMYRSIRNAPKPNVPPL